MGVSSDIFHMFIVDGSRVYAASSGMVGRSAVFTYGQPSAGLLFLKMSLVRRAPMPAIPGKFRLRHFSVLCLHSSIAFQYS